MKLSVTLRTGLVMLMLLAIVPLLGMSLFDAVMGARDAETQTTKNLEISASLVAVNQQQVANSARQVLTAISHLPDLVEGREPACQRYFKTLTAELPVYTNIGIIGADGYIRCHSAGNNPTRFAGDRTYFQSAIAHGDFVADGYAIGRLSGKPIMTAESTTTAGSIIVGVSRDALWPRRTSLARRK